MYVYNARNYSKNTEQGCGMCDSHLHAKRLDVVGAVGTAGKVTQVELRNVQEKYKGEGVRVGWVADSGSGVRAREIKKGREGETGREKLYKRVRAASSAHPPGSGSSRHPTAWAWCR